MPDYKAVPVGELQVTLQLPFWGDVSPYFRCEAARAWDTGRDEDFKAATDSKAAPKSGPSRSIGTDDFSI